MTPSPGRRVLLALLSIPLLTTLAACGAGAGEDAAGGSDSRAQPARDSAATAGLDTVGDNAAKTPLAPAVDSVIARAVIATGELRVSTPRLRDARQDAVDLVTGVRGFVAEEQSRSDLHGRLDRVDLTLRVPAQSFEAALDDLAALGTVRHRQQAVEDVTTQVIDNAARVRAQKASVASIERLLAQATSIAEIMSVERQLASRQAELDSLEQQQKWLADQTSLSTIRLTLVPPPEEPAVVATGFLGGLQAGWHALGATAVALGAVTGAVLPFAVLLALVAGPAWAVIRRRRTVVGPPPAASEV